MVGYAGTGNPVCIVHADMTLIQCRSRSRSRGNDRQPPSGAFISYLMYMKISDVLLVLVSESVGEEERILCS